ncbi:MAG: hypothetical protein IRZ32_14880 [Solirubrobacteraceae bacterium]|nr:hypothetical protein [Solirubrobacteraceae bacterium]
MRRPELPCVLLAAAIGAAYLAFAPGGADLVAAAFRSDLFARHGFVVVNEAWYGGHHVPAYSLLGPALMAWVGPRVAATVAVVVASGLFAALLARTVPRRPTLPAGLWFAAGAGAMLFTDRIAFLTGLPFALGALLALAHERRALALALAVVTPLVSPVDGAFLALAAVAWGIAARRPLGIGIAVAALAPVAVLNALFPEGGDFPLPATVYWPALAALAIVWWAAADPQLRVVRVGAALYAAALTLCFLVPNAAGANVTRLAALTAGPVLALALWDRRRALLALLALPMAYWTLLPAATSVSRAAGDPSRHAAYYDGLLAELERIEAREGPIRVEIPFTQDHWEAHYVAERVPIARGWLRQLDRDVNGIFYGRPRLNPGNYTAWLRDNAIAYVAIPDVRLDGSAATESRVLAAGLPALREVWHDDHWRLYRVEGARPLGVTALGPDGFAVRATPGHLTVDTRVRFSPHWAVVAGDGCVSRAPGGWTRVRARRPGELRVGVRLAPLRAALGRTGERCS